MARRPISIDEMGGLEVDDADGRLYWRGKGVVLEQKISLEGWTLVLAVIGTIAAVVGAAWPIVDHFIL